MGSIQIVVITNKILTLTASSKDTIRSLPGAWKKTRESPWPMGQRQHACSGPSLSEPLHPFPGRLRNRRAGPHHQFTLFQPQKLPHPRPPQNPVQVPARRQHLTAPGYNTTRCKSSSIQGGSKYGITPAGRHYPEESQAPSHNPGTSREIGNPCG